MFVNLYLSSSALSLLGKLFCFVLFCFNFSTLHNPPTIADQGLTLPDRPNYNSTKNVYLYYTVYLHPVLIAFITLSFYNLSILFN